MILVVKLRQKMFLKYLFAVVELSPFLSGFVYFSVFIYKNI